MTKNKTLNVENVEPSQTQINEGSKKNSFVQQINNKLEQNKYTSFYMKNRLWFNFGLLAVLFLANCFASWVTYIAFPLLAIMMLADNLENGISYIMFAIPFCVIYPYVSLIIFLSAIFLYIVKFYLIYFIVDKGKVSWVELLFMGLFIVYAVLPIGTYSINTLFKLVIIVTIYAGLLAMSKKFKIFRMGFNIKILAGAVLLSCVLGLFYFVSPYLQSILVIYESGSLLRYQALLPSTNVLAMLCEIILAILAYQIIKNKGGLIDSILFGCIALAGVFTFSKLYYVTLVIILVSFFIGMMTVNWKKTLIVASVVVGVLAVAILAIYFIKPGIINDMLARFGTFSGSLDEIMQTLTTGRWDIWKNTFACWATNPLYFFLGRGLGAGIAPNASNSTHNAYIAILDQLGLVGALLFIIPLIFLFRDIAKSQDTKISKAIAIPIIVLSIIFLSEDLLFFIFKF